MISSKPRSISTHHFDWSIDNILPKVDQLDLDNIH